MKDSEVLKGVVIESAPVGENDRRLVLLTREEGRVTAFASGCRKATSPLCAFTRPFTFASFSVFPGKNSFRLIGAEMIESFDGISSDFEMLTYGSYFLEFAGYFAVEGAPAAEEIDLLFLTLKALLKKAVPPKLIKAVFEMRMMTIQGIAPGTDTCLICGKKLTDGFFLPGRGGVGCGECIADTEGLLHLGNSELYAMQYVQTAPLSKLYSFTLAPAHEEQFVRASEKYCALHISKRFKTLDMLSGAF